jgi:SAM-dependent methyltransferase
MKRFNWEKFIKATRSRKPIPFLQETIKGIKLPKGLALDIGCGAGVDAKYLAKNGFRVIAVDNNKNSVSQAKKSCKNLQVEIVRKDIREYKIRPDSHKLIVAWNVLSFLKKRSVLRIFYDIQRGLENRGVFVFSVFGNEDEWVKKFKLTSFSVNELKDILNGMSFIKLLEEKKRMKSALGELKFWHIIKVIAQKKIAIGKKLINKKVILSRNNGKIFSGFFLQQTSFISACLAF